jgi:hypothetical protein
MGLDNLAQAEADIIGVDSVQKASTTATMNIYTNVFIGDTSGGAFTVTLPVPALCPGKVVDVILAVAGAAMTISGPGKKVYHNDNLDTAGDSVTLRSNGVSWIELGSAIA